MMPRRTLTEEQRKLGTIAAAAARSLAAEARKSRREAELALLDKLLAEAAMPEWYPHQ